MHLFCTLLTIFLYLAQTISTIYISCFEAGNCSIRRHFHNKINQYWNFQTMHALKTQNVKKVNCFKTLEL